MICNLAVSSYKGTMSDADFVAFPNRLVTVSGAAEEERTVFFEGLVPE